MKCVIFLLSCVLVTFVNSKSQYLRKYKDNNPVILSDTDDCFPCECDMRRKLTNVLTNVTVYDSMTIFNESYIEVYSRGDNLDDTWVIQKALCMIKNLSDELCGDKYVVTDNSLSGTVKLVSKLYNINSNIKIYSNIVFEGMGMYLTSIRLQDNADSFYEYPNSTSSKGGVSGIIRSVYQNNIIMRDMTIDGNRENQLEDGEDDDNYSYGKFGIYLEVVDDTVMTNLRVMNCQGYGFDPHGKGGEYLISSRLKIVDCISENNGWDGITLDKLHDTIVTDNVVRNNGRHGINIVTGSRRLVVSRNVVINNGFFYDNGGCGIVVQNNQNYTTRDITLSNNIIRNTKKDGICAKSTTNLIISGNNIFNASGCMKFENNKGFEYGVSYSLITGNICNAERGIKFKTESSYNIVSYNQIKIMDGFNEYGIDDREKTKYLSTNKYSDNIFVNTLRGEIRYLSVGDGIRKFITIAPYNSVSNADYYCDGINDHIVIQTAICELKGLSLSDCGGKNDFPPTELKGVVKLLTGTFNINSNIYLYSNSILEGEGMNNTILKLQDDASSFIQYPWKEDDRGSQSGLIRALYESNIEVRHLTLDGNKDGQIRDIPEIHNDTFSYGRFGVYYEVVDNAIIDNVKVMNFQGYGLDPHGTPGIDQPSTRIKITDCIVENNDWDGITLDKLRDTLVSNNIVTHNGRHGINIVTGSRRLVVSNNIIKNNGFLYPQPGCGIMAQNNDNFITKDLTITGNMIENSANDGICINSVQGSIISLNNILSARYCIKLSRTDGLTKGSYENIISGNICTSEKGIILEQKSKYNLVTSNAIKLTALGTGISNLGETENEATNIITNNIFIKGILEKVKYGFGNETSDNPVYFILLDVQTSVITNEYNVLPTYKSNEIETSDISGIVDYNYNTLSSVSVEIKVFLSNKIFYPTIMEYTKYNNHNGFIAPILEPTNGWINGVNIIQFPIYDEYYVDLEEIDWYNMDRLQVYRSGPAEVNNTELIHFYYIKIAKTSDL
jgi:parallel beta-helix repeat protein